MQDEIDRLEFELLVMEDKKHKASSLITGLDYDLEHDRRNLADGMSYDLDDIDVDDLRTLLKCAYNDLDYVLKQVHKVAEKASLL